MEKNLKEFKFLLETRLKETNRVFIVPHCTLDFDAIGSASGMAEICSHLGKQAIIVSDDELTQMNVGIRSIYEIALGKYTFLTSEQFQSCTFSDDLLLFVDVGKMNLIPSAVANRLSQFSHVMLLDHHKEDENSIPTFEKYVNTDISSACEVVTRLCRMFSTSIDKWLAKALLAGIFVDTNKLKKNTNDSTLGIAAHLIRRGATIQAVNDLFVEDFENDRKIHHLIDGTEFITHSIHSVALIYNHEHPETIYTQAELAQAADYLLPYKVDASFAIGRISDTDIGISARTSGGMDIVEIMHIFQGGGNGYSAAARILNVTDLTFIMQQLLRLIKCEDFYTVKGEVLTEEVRNQVDAESLCLATTEESSHQKVYVAC